MRGQTAGRPGAARGLRLSCSPITYMGEAQQTAWKMIRSGQLGQVRVVYCEVNWGRIESWHPNPGPFYEVGALFDVGVYPLTLVTTFLAPERRVTAYGKVLHPDRVTQEGVPFHIDTPDWVVAAVGLADGTVVRLTTNFYVGQHGKQKGLEFHGDLGSLYLSSFQDFHAEVELAGYDEAYVPVPLVRPAFQGVDWGRSVAEIADAIAEDRPQRATRRTGRPCRRDLRRHQPVPANRPPGRDDVHVYAALANGLGAVRKFATGRTSTRSAQAGQAVTAFSSPSILQNANTAAPSAESARRGPSPESRPIAASRRSEAACCCRLSTNPATRP